MNTFKEDDNIIYELLNYSDEDDTEIESFELDNLTSKKIKNKINKKLLINKNKRNYIAAAILLICIGIFTFNNFAMASNVSSSIIQTMKLLSGDYADYKKYTHDVNITSSDKGIQFVINEIVCDENQIIISYSITSENDLSKIINYPNMIFADFKINDKELTGGFGCDMKQVNSNKYDGIIELDALRYRTSNTFYLQINNITINELKGNWKFNIKINNKDIQKETKIFKTNKTLNLNGSKINIKKISITPLSTALEASGDLMKYHYMIFDDKGNMIKSTSESIENSTKGEFHYTALPLSNAKSLTFLPYNYQKNYIPNPRLYDIDKLPIEMSQGDLGKLTVNKLEWDNDILNVYYTAEGKIPVKQSEGLAIYDEEGKMYLSENEYNTKVNPLNQHDFIMHFKGLSKDKKYKIGTERLEEYYKLYENLKFTIELK